MVIVTVNEKQNFCLVEPQGPLSEDDFAMISSQVDSLIERKGRLDGIIIKTRDFPGWEKFRDVVDHFRFIKDHHRLIKKVALVTDAKVLDLFPAVINHFVKAEVKNFEFDEYDEAIDWVS